jgi:hypothetical protein
LKTRIALLATIAKPAEVAEQLLKPGVKTLAF